MLAGKMSALASCDAQIAGLVLRRIGFAAHYLSMTQGSYQGDPAGNVDKQSWEKEVECIVAPGNGLDRDQIKNCRGTCDDVGEAAEANDIPRE
jgi:hypothetical protein